MVKISRCALDIAMAALTLVLMGGCNFFYEAFDESFDSDLIHEILCVLFLMASGVILSNHVFAWIGIESATSFARTAHMLASHWYLFFVSLHIGLHLSLFVRGKVAMGVLSALGVYGVYAFIERGLWKYMTLQQPFFSVDLEHGCLLFTLDYIAIMALFAVVMQLVMQALNRYFYIRKA